MATNIVKVNLESPRTVDSIAALEALNVSKQTGTVYLDAGGRSGWFKWNGNDNLSSEVSNDTGQGIYVAPSSDTTGESGAWVRDYDGALNVKWFGALGDGSTNDTPAIQAAVDYADFLGGGRVYVPSTTNYYRIDASASGGPIYMRDFVHVYGDGQGSMLYNDTADTSTGYNNTVIRFGNYAPSTWAGSNFYSASAISAGDRTITLTSSLAINNFSVDDLFVLRSTEKFVNSNGIDKPKELYVNKIESISGSVITCKYTIPADITNPLVSVNGDAPNITNGSDEFNEPWYIVEGCKLSDIKIKSDGIWSNRHAMFEGVWNNLWIESDVGIYGNGFIHSVCNVDAICDDRFLEIDLAAHNSKITLRAKRNPAVADTPNTVGVLLASNNKYLDLDITADAGNYFSNGFMSVRSGVSYLNAKVRARGDASNIAYGLLLNSGDSLSGGVTPIMSNNTFDLHFDWPSFNRYIRIIDDNESSSARIQNTTIKANCFGDLSTSNAVTLSGYRTIIRDSYFENGDIALETTTTNSISECAIYNTHIGGGLNSLGGTTTAKNVYFARSKQIGRGKINVVNVDAASTTAGNVISSFVIPTGTIKTGDKIKFVVGGNMVGTNGIKTVRLYHSEDGSDLFTYTASASNTDFFRIEGETTFLTTGLWRTTAFVGNETSYTTDFSNLIYQTASGDSTIELQAWTSNGADEATILHSTVEVIPLEDA